MMSEDFDFDNDFDGKLEKSILPGFEWPGSSSDEETSDDNGDSNDD